LKDRPVTFPVWPFAGVLASSDLHPDEVEQSIRSVFGLSGPASDALPFSDSTYYHDEMGEGLTRRFFASDRGIPPDEMPAWKTRAREIEATWSRNGKRRLNVDPGYLDLFKVVLLSSKYGGGKVYIGNACYADVVLLYENGSWHSPPRTFPDFRDGRYLPYFQMLRERFRRKCGKPKGLQGADTF